MVARLPGFVAWQRGLSPLTEVSSCKRLQPNCQSVWVLQSKFMTISLVPKGRFDGYVPLTRYQSVVAILYGPSVS